MKMMLHINQKIFQWKKLYQFHLVGLTALQALIEKANLKKEQKVFIQVGSYLGKPFT
jgi:hypothetical protein